MAIRKQFRASLHQAVALIQHAQTTPWKHSHATAHLVVPCWLCGVFAVVTPGTLVVMILCPLIFVFATSTKILPLRTLQ